MSATDAVGHLNRRRKPRKRRPQCNSSDRRLSREVVVRNNVKHDALSNHSLDHNRSNSHAHHSGLNVRGRHRHRLSVRRHQ